MKHLGEVKKDSRGFEDKREKLTSKWKKKRLKTFLIILNLTIEVMKIQFNNYLTISRHPLNVLVHRDE